MAAPITFKEAQELAMAKVVHLTEAKAHALKEVVDCVTAWLLTTGIRESIAADRGFSVTFRMDSIGRPADWVSAHFWASASPRPYVTVTISPTGDVFEEDVLKAVAQNLRDAGFVGTLAKSNSTSSFVQICL